MGRLVVSVTSIMVLLTVLSGVALAQTSPPSQTAPGSTGQMPNVSSLKPFSIEANYMSLPGYLRYLMHQQTGQWMTYAEAKRAVQQGQ